MISRIIAAVGVVGIAVIGISTCSVLDSRGMSGLGGYVIVACIGWALCWTGFCLAAGVAFSESATQGLCCIFVPFYVLIYAGRNCQPYLAVWGVGFVISLVVRFAQPNVGASPQLSQNDQFVQPQSPPVTPRPTTVFPSSRPGVAVPQSAAPTAEETLHSLHEKMIEDQKKRAAEEEAQERERKGPDPSDPAYLDKLVDRMLSGNILYKSDALDALLKADPATASPETKKKVARAFKTLAEEEHSFETEKAVRGLVRWAGTYSVPVLLKMLNNGRRFDEDHIIRALAELQDPRAVPALVKMLNDSRGSHNDELIVKTLVEFKDPRAAPALAARIDDFRVGRLACDGLLDIGSAAEDALIAVGDTDNTKICIAALTLLGDVGTEKSFDLMHRAQGSRDRTVRQTAMAATAKINRRRLAAKAKSKVD